MDYFRSYHTVNGRIISTSVNNQNPVALMTDALGSVVRTESQYGGANFRYTAYGKLMKTTPGYTNYGFGWVGSLGYRQTNLTHAEQYVRARHYSSTETRWTSVDPLWPMQRRYNYAGGRATLLTDPSGLSPCKKGCHCKPRSYSHINCSGHKFLGGFGESIDWKYQQTIDETVNSHCDSQRTRISDWKITVQDTHGLILDICDLLAGKTCEVACASLFPEAELFCKIACTLIDKLHLCDFIKCTKGVMTLTYHCVNKQNTICPKKPEPPTSEGTISGRCGSHVFHHRISPCKNECYPWP